MTETNSELSAQCNELITSLRPLRGQRIFDLVQQAGVDMNFWLVSAKTQKAIDPSDNIYQSTQWSFGGGKDPIVVCIWWKDLRCEGDRIVRTGSSKADIQTWTKLADEIRARGEKENRLTRKQNKAQALDLLLSEAHLRRKPIRVVLLDGKTPPMDEAAYESAIASERELDEKEWWVHEHNPYTGTYLLVRDVPMPAVIPKDPFDDAPDPSDDPLVKQIEESDLSRTEKDALIKIRVGQGWFRQALIKRWGGCAVTRCQDPSLLIASHIKPWSECRTRAERLSPDNGLLLSPNLDKAFDRGLISFSDTFKILLSPALHLQSQNTLQINAGLQLHNRTFEGSKPFLRWHRIFHGFEKAPDAD